MQDHYEHEGRRQRGIVMSFFEGIYEFFAVSLRTIGQHKELFLGVAFTLVGLLSFKSDKFCDGNTADYLSCTRPSTYYFYSPLDIAVITVGVFLIMIWVLKARRDR